MPTSTLAVEGTSIQFYVKAKSIIGEDFYVGIEGVRADGNVIVCGKIVKNLLAGDRMPLAGVAAEVVIQNEPPLALGIVALRCFPRHRFHLAFG